jgi:hypothetical protein
VIREHDRVVLKKAVIEHGLQPGDIGAVVHVYSDRAAYEVEFVTLTGQTAAVITVSGDQVRPVSTREIPHARELIRR